jgi:N-acetyl-gamma-glutamyl-phosphate reductase
MKLHSAWMITRVANLGASGYVGGQLHRLLSLHPSLECAVAFASSNAGQTLAAVHPHLSLAYPGVKFVSWDPALLARADLVFAALPHGESQRIADEVIARDLPFVDLGADFRLDSAESYKRWYKEEHQRPDLLGSFFYGLPEFARDSIREARRVAAPGCYPTTATLALRPLVDAGLIETTGIIVDAASGVSGAGRGANQGTHFNTVAESFRAYGLVNHRPTAEMEMMIGGEVLFTPHLAPMNRGILATCYARPTRKLGADEALDVLKAAYAAEPFVHAGEAVPETKWVLGSNAAFVTARFDPRTDMVVAVSAIDNLVKGAAGQMIQCANLMLGLDETAGLSSVGVYP